MSRHGRSPAADDEAASWDARLRSHDCSQAEQDQFRHWLDENKQNRRSFEQLQASLLLIRQGAGHPQLLNMRESARVMERRLALYGSAKRIAVVVGLATMLASYVLWGTQVREFMLPASGHSLTRSVVTATSDGIGAWKTQPGERTQISLPDGSLILVNASSRIQAEYSVKERRITLLDGDAFFRVSKGDPRPFVVAAGLSAVTALGTTFEVRLRAAHLRVILVEGRLAVKTSEPALTPSLIKMEQNQQLELVGVAAPTVSRIDAVAETAWAGDQVIFSDVSLPDAVAMMNQYGKTKIIAGNELTPIRVNGMFRAGNQDSFVNALTSYYPIDAHQTVDGSITLELRPTTGPADIH